jgi:hypothetical protein
MTGDNNIRIENLEKKIHRVVLGLDVSTTCIGASIVIDDGVSKPEIVKITHVAPKIPKEIKGIESIINKSLSSFPNELAKGDIISIFSPEIVSYLPFPISNTLFSDKTPK